MKKYIKCTDLIEDDINISELSEDDFVKFELRPYADYFCSCGCGRLCGNPFVVYYDFDLCKVVGRKDDYEGHYWREFRKDCWDRLNLENKPLKEIYLTYPESEYFDGNWFEQVKQDGTYDMYPERFREEVENGRYFDA